MTPKLKILFANSIQMFAGGEIWMLSTMQELRNRGHEITLLCRPNTELARRAQALNFNLFQLPIRGDFDPVTIFQIYKWLKNHETDIILTNMDKELRLCGMAAKFVKPRPVVISRRGIDYPLKNKIHYRFSYNTLADFIVANSKSTKQALLKNAPWLNPDRIQVIYNGVNPEKYQPENTGNLRSEFNIAPNAPLIGFVGQLDERKGLDNLFPAFKKITQAIPDAVLLIVGTGVLQQRIETFIVQNRLERNIRLAGFRNDIPNIMRTIDLLVLPSWWEGFGIVIIEAMAAGKPVITTNVSSMPEIVIHGQTGLVVPVKDDAELYQAMLELVQNLDKAGRMGAQGREVVLEKFTITGMIDQYLALFNKLHHYRKSGI
jgi:glycosyltransferase involved in cell wall biosynthesis